MMPNYKGGYTAANFKNTVEVCGLFKVSKHIFQIFLLHDSTGSLYA